MLVQGLGVAKMVETSLEPVELAGARATALALVFSELLQNALEHGGGSVRVELAKLNGDVRLAIVDDGAGTLGSGASSRELACRSRRRAGARTSSAGTPHAVLGRRMRAQV